MDKRICSSDDCEGNVLARGMCVTHYHRWHRTVRPPKAESRPCDGCGNLIHRTRPTGEIQHYCSSDCRPRCAIAGCEKPRHGNVYCTEHHTRWKRTGDPLTPLKRQPNVGNCTVKGCDQPSRKTGWCASHYAQWKRYGEVKPFIYKWGEGLYAPMHALLARQMGSARTFPCVECGTQADEWSYNYDDPDEITDETHSGCVFSRKLESYSPRCIPCHRKFDANQRMPP